MHITGCLNQPGCHNFTGVDSSHQNKNTCIQADKCATFCFRNNNLLEKKKRQRPCTRKVYKRYSHTKGVENPKSLLDLKDSKGEMGKIEYSPIQKEVSKRHILTKQTRLTRLEKYQSLIFFQRHP